MERHFDEELRELNEMILKMGLQVQEMIAESVESLKNQDVAKAKEVIDSDKRIDETELVIDDFSINLLATRQPMARDLRFITQAYRITADLERMADLAVDIAQRTEEISDQPLVKPLVDIPKLAVLSQQMVKDVLDAFVNHDVQLARSVCSRDDEVDRLKDLVYEELIEIISRDGSKAKRGIPLILVARHLERICDHATNIAEDIVYMFEGRVIKHHHPFNA